MFNHFVVYTHTHGIQKWFLILWDIQPWRHKNDSSSGIPNFNSIKSQNDCKPSLREILIFAYENFVNKLISKLMFTSTYAVYKMLQTISKFIYVVFECMVDSKSSLN